MLGFEPLSTSFAAQHGGSSPLDSPFGMPHGGGVRTLSRKSRLMSRAGGKVSET